jgi:large subunit ribosomal protein L9
LYPAPAASVLRYQAGTQHRAITVCGARVLEFRTDSCIVESVIVRESAVKPIFVNGVIMEVILKEDVPKLGSRGDVVKVTDGYGRNYLLPHKLAIEASTGNKAVIEQMKSAAVRRFAKEKAGAEALAKQFDGVSVSFQRRTGEKEQLFGSVTSSDIADALIKKGFNIDRRKIQVHEPLKTLGEFAVPIRLHKDVTAHLKVVIEKEAAE